MLAQTAARSFSAAGLTRQPVPVKTRFYHRPSLEGLMADRHVSAETPARAAAGVLARGE